MADIATNLGAAAAAIIWIGISLAAYRRLAGYHKKRLLRCPETGSIALVSVEKAELSGDSIHEAPGLKVLQCQLWPQRKDCGRGCLTRCAPMSQGHGFNLYSLRPFENGTL